MTSDEIRKRFLNFFATRDHRLVRSSSLVPANDPTLLFTNAGMNQFKDVFLGRDKRDYVRACSSQKCVRAGGKHNDLEQVGRTTRHHTFFEMLGNFSFGDYFKKEAIPWAWELVTKDFGLPDDRLYVTVFREDDEAEEIWAKDVGVSRERIFRFDEKDNFWAMGDTGPCGPCSEIHYDLGPKASDLGHKDCRFPCDCGRYVELWNLVFMQFDRDEQGKLTPLPRPSIDTGAGLERFATILQGKTSNFETDLFRPLMQEAEGLSRVLSDPAGEYQPSLRIIADHSRAATFLIADGVLPSNEGRGYVLRKIIRRAVRHGRMIGVNERFFFRMAALVVEIMEKPYPELTEAAQRVASVIKSEEERYEHSLTLALRKLNEEIESAAKQRADIALAYRQDGTAEVSCFPAGGPLLLPGEGAFRLYDTYGLSLDLLRDEGLWRGFVVDYQGFDRQMQKQRERARASWKGAEKKVASPVYLELAERYKTSFDGYRKTTSSPRQIVALIQDGKLVNEVKPGSEVGIVLARTPFYGEAGGQVGDTGRFFALESFEEVAHIHDTYYPVGSLIVHKAIAREALHTGDWVRPIVDAARRDAIRRNHTATHLLHAALRKTLGTHVKQAGSLVAPDRLRFDFTHYAALDEQDLLDIEDLVNERILANVTVATQMTDLDTAVGSGAMALFGEKYGDQVRVLSIGDFSKELCGGTHVQRTGDIGLFKVISESSVAAGMRRIEALTGEGVLDYLRRSGQTLAQLSDVLRAKPDELLEAVEKLTESEKKLRKQLESQQLRQAAAQAGDLAETAVEVKGIRVVAARVEATDRAAMRQLVDNLRARLGSGVIVLGSVGDQRVNLVAAVSKDLTDRLDAGKLVRAAAAIVEGSGGGRRDLAEAGGKNPAKLDEALRAVPGFVENML